MQICFSCVVLAAVVAIVVAILIFLCYMGFFKKIEVEVREIPTYTVINLNYTGEYKDMYKAMPHMEKKVKELIPELPTISVAGSAYYNAPGDVKDSKDNKWSMFYILDDFPDVLEKAKQLPKSEEYSVVTIPKSKAIYATFPNRNPISYMMGPMKVYPAITEFMNKNDIKSVGCVEIYHMNQDPTEYAMYLENKEVFEEMEKTNFFAVGSL